MAKFIIYKELRKALKDGGHSFKSDSDTEVLLKLFNGGERSMFREAKWLLFICDLRQSRKDTLFSKGQDGHQALALQHG